LFNRDSSFTLTVKPKLNFPDTEALDSVLVEVEVLPIRIQTEFPSVQVAASSDSKNVKISPSTARVVVEGSQKLAESFKEEAKVVVKVDGLNRGRYRIRGEIELPEGLKMVTLEPPTFLVEVTP